MHEWSHSLLLLCYVLGGDVVEVVPAGQVAKHQWYPQAVRGRWGKRGQRVHRQSWAKSKQPQGVRGAWGKRGVLIPGGEYLVVEQEDRKKVDKRLNSKHVIKLINKGGQKKLGGMWGKRGNT